MLLAPIPGLNRSIKFLITLPLALLLALTLAACGGGLSLDDYAEECGEWEEDYPSFRTWDVSEEDFEAEDIEQLMAFLVLAAAFASTNGEGDSFFDVSETDETEEDAEEALAAQEDWDAINPPGEVKALHDIRATVLELAVDASEKAVELADRMDELQDNPDDMEDLLPDLEDFLEGLVDTQDELLDLRDDLEEEWEDLSSGVQGDLMDEGCTFGTRGSSGGDSRSDRERGETAVGLPFGGQSEPRPTAEPDAAFPFLGQSEPQPTDEPAVAFPFPGQSEPQPTATPRPAPTAPPVMPAPPPTLAAVAAPAPTVSPLSGSVETDRAALEALYEATDGDSWYNVNNWLSSKPLNQWQGVETDPYGRVIGLYLYENLLSGELPSELGDLSALQELYLHNNQLSGEIPPELGDLSNLQELHLYANQLSGEIPPELGHLSNLLELSLAANQLSGGIPPELGHLSNLQKLYIGYNQLSGEIPPELGNLSNLQQLDLRNNQMSGKIPPELDNLDRLGEFYLRGDRQSNEFAGCISHFLHRYTGDILPICPEHPEERAAVIALYQAWNISPAGYPLQEGQESSEFPLLVQLNNITLGAEGRVIVLNFRGHDLRGEIPVELAALTHLRTLDLSSNNLRGEIPDELEALTKLNSLNLANNNFTCVPSHLQRRWDDPEKFTLDGSLPAC